MNTLSKGIVIAGLGSLLISFGADAAQAADREKTMVPRTCYAGTPDRVELANYSSALGGGEPKRESGDLRVTPGSPCKDLNVRSTSGCVQLRVAWQDNGVVGAWKRVCAGSGWQQLAYRAREGRLYRVQAQGRADRVVVVRG